MAAALGTLGELPRFDRVAVTYTAYGLGGPMDRDNVIGCGKPVLDAVHRAGVLVDDTPEHVESVAGRWERSPLPWPFVVVELRRVSARR